MKHHSKLTATETEVDFLFMFVLVSGNKEENSAKLIEIVVV